MDDTIKQCSKCNKIKNIKHFSFRGDGTGRWRSHCRQCINEYGKSYRKTSSVSRNAQSLARHAVKKGLIERKELCECCGNKKQLDKHHPDYNYPLKVLWLCRKCHRATIQQYKPRSLS